MSVYKLNSLRTQGYRPFKDFVADLGYLEVLIGANGSGKSSLFEFLKFLRDSSYLDIPPEIVTGSIGQQIFHIPGPDRFSWSLDVSLNNDIPIQYQGELMGPVGRTHVSFEKVQFSHPVLNHTEPFRLMDIQERKGFIQDSGNIPKQEILLKRPNQLALSTITNPSMVTLYNLREYIRSWRFYSSFNFSNEQIRKTVPIEQEPVLHENAGNLSSVLHYLMTEHPSLFDDLKQHLKQVVPGFKNITVIARGGLGEVIAFWEEESIDKKLSLADLSDGTLRLLCWIVLCLTPNPPFLVCIDEPDQGIHPRALPILAGLFEKASSRTQIFLATHSSYFLMQFDLDKIAVFRKENGEAKFIKPSNSKTLKGILSDFGPDEIEATHRSEELEKLA